MAQVVVLVEVTDDELKRGWHGDVSELGASIRATLHELIGDDDVPYVPYVTIGTLEKSW